MTTKNPRITITLPPALAAQIKRLSELTGDSQSAIVADLLEVSAPVFDRVIKVLEAAEVAKGTIKSQLSEDLEKAQERIEHQLGIVLEELDGATTSLIEEAEKVTRRARSTPLSNRGVRSDPTHTKQQLTKTGTGVEK